MKIITKYYDNSGKLRLSKNSRDIKNKSYIRLKILRNGKEFPCCDFGGKCENKTYAEVYPMLMKEKEGWSYLCKKHYFQEQKRLKLKLPASLSVGW